MKEKVRVLIVEDEFVTLDTLRDELEEIGYEISGDAMRINEALIVLARGDTDIAILDIHLQGGESGIRLAEMIREQYHIPFIFLTAYSDRQTVSAAAATRPAGYLVKPFTQADLYTSIELALTNFADNGPQANGAHQKPTSGELLIRDSIYVKDEQRFRKIRLEKILYVEAFKNYLELYLEDGRHVIRSTMKDFLALLPSDRFVQTHRSYAVNIQRIDEVGSNYLVIKNTRLPISRNKKEDVMKRMKLYL